MKFAWQVVQINGDVEHGVADTFEAAVKALADWHGTPADHPHASYLIVPFKA